MHVRLFLHFFVVEIMIINNVYFYSQKQEKQHLPTGDQGAVVLTAVKDEDKGGKSGDDEPGADEKLLKDQESGGAVNA